MTINTPISIDQPLVDQFSKNGHIRINNLCEGDDLNQFRKAVNYAVEARKKNISLLPMEQRNTYDKAFLQIMNLWTEYPAVKAFVLSKRFASIAAQLLGVKKVRVYHDQALFKEAHGGLTPWHQDQHYWPLETDKCVTMWMPLISVSKNMGTLNFASGTGNAGYLGDIPISDDSDRYLSKLCEDNQYTITNHGDMNAGDATFHSGWCLHSAPGNSSAVMREVMTIIWFADGTRIIPYPDNKNRWNQSRWDDMGRWMPDRKPGEMADGKLTPLISPFDFS